MKETASTIAPALTAIFKKSLDTEEVPEDWRTANVTPIFKKGTRYTTSNYRPVSLTCISSKLMEHIVLRCIMDHADKNNILYSLQHGFRSSRSCESQLLSFTDDVSKNLNNNRQTDILIVDFSKAFDKVDHSLLCYKLKTYGIRGKINGWIRAFLSNRKQCVVVEGENSSYVPVESGVPQGSATLLQSAFAESMLQNAPMASSFLMHHYSICHNHHFLAYSQFIYSLLV